MDWYEFLEIMAPGEWFWAIFEATPIWSNFTFVQICMWIGSDYGGRYDWSGVRRVIYINIRANSQLDLITLLGHFLSISLLLYIQIMNICINTTLNDA